MQLNVFAYFLLLAVFIGCVRQEDEAFSTGTGTNGSDTEIASALFTAYLCEDLTADPTCTEFFVPFAGVNIRLFTSEEARENGSPLHLQQATGEDGTVRFNRLTPDTYYWSAHHPADDTDTRIGVIDPTRSVIPQTILEFTN